VYLSLQPRVSVSKMSKFIGLQRYDTIRDAILTCAQKLVGQELSQLILLHVSVNSLGNPWSQSPKKKKKVTPLRREGFAERKNERVRGDG